MCTNHAVHDADTRFVQFCYVSRNMQAVSMQFLNHFILHFADLFWATTAVVYRAGVLFTTVQVYFFGLA